MDISFRFKKEISEEKEQEMWAQFFSAIGLFANENMPTFEIDYPEKKEVSNTNYFQEDRANPKD